MSPDPVSGFLAKLWHTKAPAPEKPFRDELLSVERLEERALALAASFTTDPTPRRARSIFPRFDDNARVLRDAYRTPELPSAFKRLQLFCLMPPRQVFSAC